VHYNENKCILNEAVKESKTANFKERHVFPQGNSRRQCSIKNFPAIRTIA
jgi:hypothetical protein